VFFWDPDAERSKYQEVQTRSSWHLLAFRFVSVPAISHIHCNALIILAIREPSHWPCIIWVLT
jgi:hypothetical protein